MFGEGNRVADWLANFGHVEDIGLHILAFSPRIMGFFFLVK